MNLNLFSKKLSLFFLTFLILLQSCQVYDKGSVSLEEASKTELRAKISTVDVAKIKYKKIVFENQEYFGLKKKNGNWVKFPLRQQNIETLRLQNKKKSTWATVGLALGFPIFLILLAALYCGTEGCIKLWD
ncbi:hypothetical protein [Eudoraea chungangensis]|uniref:hypothetical protein n=1 Tax=Eudoraea chungangensis TaxID=1481905 RepID=UPI0023EB725F|nr:hypothetical protein [Eudoraea chungangensis]